MMLLSLKAGGIGLNLTAADHVFLIDPWWRMKAITGMPVRHLLTPDREGVELLRQALRTLRARVRRRLSLRA